MLGLLFPFLQIACRLQRNYMNDYNRILVKISGEALSGGAHGIQSFNVRAVADELIEVASRGVQIGVVVGGGNLWRGRSSSEMDRGVADSIGMLATVMNALALSDALSMQDVKNKVVSSINVDKIARSYTLAEVNDFLEQGYIVIFAGGTGAPYFSTDTAAVLRACEINADAVFCAKAVDGVYDDDPKTNPDAVKYDEVSYDTILFDNLKALDVTAIALAREFGVRIVAYSKDEPHGILRVIEGENLGTIIK